MIDLFLSAFITFFVVIDPPGCAPIYASLTKGATAAQRRNMALRASLVAAIILFVFALFGEQLLGALHIELNSFRIAGGIMRAPRRARAEDYRHARNRGCLGLSDGDADDCRAGVDCLGHAADGAK
jgi:MarC family integral membrane protein